MACLLGIIRAKNNLHSEKNCCPKFCTLCHKNFVKWIGQTMREFNVFSTANPLGKYLSLIVKSSSIYRQSSDTKVLWNREFFLCRSGAWTMNVQAMKLQNMIDRMGWFGPWWAGHSEQLPYARHYNPWFVYLLPTEVHLCTVTFGLMYG